MRGSVDAACGTDALGEFLNLALDYESRETPSLQGFIAWLRTAKTDVKRDMEITRDEVRVMTVHGAKGLEAPIVFLPETTLTQTARGSPLMRAGRPGELAARQFQRRGAGDRRIHSEVLCLVVGSALWDYYMNAPWTRDGRVRADVVAVAPDGAGVLLRRQHDAGAVVRCGGRHVDQPAREHAPHSCRGRRLRDELRGRAGSEIGHRQW